MLVNAKELFSDAQAITADAISTNVIDLLPSGGAINAGRPGGPTANATVNLSGEPLYLYIQSNESFASAGNATLTITLESDDNTALSSATIHAMVAKDIGISSLAAGAWIAKGYPVPPGTYQRYLGLRYTTNTADFETGKLSAWVSNNPAHADAHDHYAIAQTTGIN